MNLMGLSNMVGSKIGMLQMKLNGILLTSEIDVKSMLEGTGAAGEDGSLSQVVTVVDEYGQGAFHITQNFGVYSAVVAVAALGICLVLRSGNTQKLAEIKESIIPKAFGIAVLFGAIAIVSFFQKFGANILPTS